MGNFAFFEAGQSIRSVSFLGYLPFSGNFWDFGGPLVVCSPVLYVEASFVCHFGLHLFFGHICVYTDVCKPFIYIIALVKQYC